MKEAFLTTLIVSLVALVIFFITALFVMWVWNGLMPDLFGLKEITYCQAYLLQLLCWLLIPHSSQTSKS